MILLNKNKSDKGNSINRIKKESGEPDSRAGARLL